MIGAVLTIDHPSPALIKERNFASVSHGKVDDAYFDADSGWFVCEGTVDTETARKRIQEGDGVSCGFTVVERANGGSWHNIPFTQEDLKIEFHHLAIVPPEKKPRIEDADIRLNAKPPMNIIGKLIQKLTGGDKSIDLTSQTAAEIDGKPVSFAEMIKAKKESDERANSIHMVGPEDYVEQDGIRYHAMDLIRHWRDNCSNSRVRMNAVENKTETAEEKTAREAEETRVAAERANTGPKTLTLTAETEVNGVKLAPGTYVLKTEEKQLSQEEIDRENAKKEVALATEKVRKEEKEKHERELAKQRGQESFKILQGASANGNPAPLPDYSSGVSGSLEDGVALGRERYGRAPTVRGSISAGKN